MPGRPRRVCGGISGHEDRCSCTGKVGQHSVYMTSDRVIQWVHLNGVILGNPRLRGVLNPNYVCVYIWLLYSIYTKTNPPLHMSNRSDQFPSHERSSVWFRMQNRISRPSFRYSRVTTCVFEKIGYCFQLEVVNPPPKKKAAIKKFRGLRILRYLFPLALENDKISRN